MKNKFLLGAFAGVLLLSSPQGYACGEEVLEEKHYQIPSPKPAFFKEHLDCKFEEDKDFPRLRHVLKGGPITLIEEKLRHGVFNCGIYEDIQRNWVLKMIELTTYEEEEEAVKFIQEKDFNDIFILPEGAVFFKDKVAWVMQKVAGCLPAHLDYKEISLEGRKNLAKIFSRMVKEGLYWDINLTNMFYALDQWTLIDTCGSRPRSRLHIFDRILNFLDDLCDRNLSYLPLLDKERNKDEEKFKARLEKLNERWNEKAFFIKELCHLVPDVIDKNFTKGFFKYLRWDQRLGKDREEIKKILEMDPEEQATYLYKDFLISPEKRMFVFYFIMYGRLLSLLPQETA